MSLAHGTQQTMNIQEAKDLFVVILIVNENTNLVYYRHYEHV